MAEIMLLPEHLKLRERKGSSHKGDNGRVLVVAGSDDFVGAAYLCSMAAFRSGVDNVTVVAPEGVAWALNCMSPDLITVKVNGGFFTPASAKRVIALSKNFDAVLVGNGFGLRDSTRKFAAAVVSGVECFKVVDADAIKSVRLQEISNAILTPHKKEFEILLGNSGCSEHDLRDKIGDNVVIVKGAVDRIVSKGRIAFNKTGNAGMTVSGTGDVLAGLAAGILAQEKDLWRSACAAAYVNGLIGDVLFRKFGYGFVASDMLECIGREVYRLYG